MSKCISHFARQGSCSVVEGRGLGTPTQIMADFRASRGPERPHHSDVRDPEPKPPFPRKPRARPAQPIFDFEWHCAQLQLFQLFGDNFHLWRPSMLPLNLRFHLADLCLLLAGCSPGWTAVCTLQALELAVWVAWLCRCCRQFGGRLWLTLFALALELVRIWRTPRFSRAPIQNKKAHANLGYLQILLLTELSHKSSPNRSRCHQYSGSCMWLTEPMLLLRIDIATPLDLRT